MINNYEITYKLSLKTIEEKFLRVKVSDTEQPEDGWYLKQCEVFREGIFTAVFENTNGEDIFCYRILIYLMKDKKPELVEKICFNSEGKKIENFGMTKDKIVFALMSEDREQKELIIFDAFNSGNEKNGVPDIDEYLEIDPGFICIAIGNILNIIKKPESEINAVDLSFVNLLRDEFGALQYDDDDEEDDDDNDDFEEDGDGKPISDLKAKKIKTSGTSDAVEKLEKLIGLEDAKNTVRKITSYIKFRKLAEKYGRKESGNICFNMVFEGNPGTAKTTVARIVAEIFAQEGVIKNGRILEAGRVDLVAKYLGQTAIKVKEVFKKAKGNILFIDEAYSLADSHDGNYGDEALATLVQEMENNRDTVVILAGYPKKMEELLSKNPGLRSRVPFKIHFSDYSVDELVKITEKEAENEGFSINGKASGKIRALCAAAINDAEFGNGRFCRNLVESAKLRHAERIINEVEDPTEEELFTLTAEDFEMPSYINAGSGKRALGFCA